MKTYKIKLQKGKIFSDNVNENLCISDEVELSEDQVKELVGQYITATGTPTHKRKYFVPNVGEEYWFISVRGEVIKDVNSGARVDNYEISIGNCFATEQDAQDELNRRQSLVRIWNNYDDKYSWDIDWNDICQQKHWIYYNNYKKTFEGKDNDSFIFNTELPYFKSAEDRNQFVEDNRDDLLTIFNIKK